MIHGTKSVLFMKRKLFLTGMAVAVCMVSCTEENLEVIENPVQTGDEIIFGSSLQNETPDTKTEYGERTSTGIPVYWVNGDKVAIFCAQASQPADRLVNYVITRQEGNPAASASVTKDELENAGLQWGNSDVHRFYAFYPADAVKGSSEENETGMITANIPVTQRPESWQEGELNGVKTYFGLPNMDYAYMYAHTSVKKSELPEGSPINLEFKNLVTVLDITVQGPEDGGSPITVSNININAVDGANVILSGDFTCNIRGAGDNTDEVTAECTAAGNLDEVRNRISIPCFNAETNEFITLNSGEQLNVKAYIIPDDDVSHIINPRQLQIVVSIMNGAVKRKLLQTANVVPHKVNRVILPHLTSGGTNFWMSDLNPNIYVTELSLPGSKMSLLTAANGANIVYQTQSIAQQLEDGVRAFIFQTERRFNNEIRLTVNGNALDLTLADALGQIADFLETCETNEKQETAFVLVTYNAGAGSEAQWFKALQETINNCASNSRYRIFNGTMSPSTTLGDVANKIIVKANYNSNGMIASAGTAPMLHTLWETAYVDGGVPMTWNDPKSARVFTWLYQEVTSVLDTDRNKNTDASAESTKEQKLQYIQTIFEESVNAYQNNAAHDIWFMNDLGGYYYYQTEITGPFGGHWGWTDHEDPAGLAEEMNNFGVQLLQERTENAGLGLVFMNFADKQEGSGVNYRSDWLIQTVIDNNFKFQLRTRSSTSSETYNASYTSGGNAIGWDK